MPGATDALAAAADSGHWQNVLIVALMLLAFTVSLSASRLFVKQWLRDAATKQEAVASSVASVAKVAADSIAASAKREAEMARTQKDSEQYVRETLAALIERTITALQEATDANRQLSISVQQSTDSNHEMKASLKELLRATYGQTALLRGKIEPELKKQTDAIREAAHLSDSEIRRRNDSVREE